MSGSKASEVIGISRAALRRWETRLGEEGLDRLEDRSGRPRRTRNPTWSAELAQAALSLREQYPRWAKDKLGLQLQQDGWQVSTSMVGRMLTRLKDRGIIGQAPLSGISTRKPPRSRPHAIRQPKDCQVHRPGDLTQMDTLDVRPLPGTVLEHFTARDVVSRWDVLGVYARATATLASSCLDTVLERMLFAVRALQVDGGSEFESAFETSCQKHGIRIFVLPPGSPKLSTGTWSEPHRTHTDEFCEVYDGSLDLTTLNSAFRKWEHVYNCVRPYRALDGRTPAQDAEDIEGCRPEMSPTTQPSHYVVDQYMVLHVSSGQSIMWPITGFGVRRKGV